MRPRESDSARSQSREKSPSLPSFAYAGAAAIRVFPLQRVRWRGIQPARSPTLPDFSSACSQAYRRKGVERADSSASQSWARTSVTVVNTRTSTLRMAFLRSARRPDAQSRGSDCGLPSDLAALVTTLTSTVDRSLDERPGERTPFQRPTVPGAVHIAHSKQLARRVRLRGRPHVHRNRSARSLGERRPSCFVGTYPPDSAGSERGGDLRGGAGGSATSGR